MSIILIGKVVVAGALAGTTLVTGIGAIHSATDATSSGVVGEHKVVCHPLRKNAPADLKKDLRDLRTLPTDERRAAVKEIRKDALAGDYGTKVQTFAEHRKERRAHWRNKAPAELKQDLRAARQAPADERTDALAEVWQSALDGKYGDRVQARAEKRKTHHEQCQAQHEERKAQQG